eukprot:GHVL01040778.1.p1 GENE.GHVL01040778.1~~GHVL01040778.1.p1  ORF type:complete len:897 (-),score=258.97 GHVL01040778.1:339-3029(-)
MKNIEECTKRAPRSGRLYKLSDSIFRKWNTRYFILVGSDLHYYDSEHDGKSKRVIKLLNSIVRYGEGSIEGRNYFFCIEPKNEKIMMLSGETEESTLEWMKSCQTASSLDKVEDLDSFFNPPDIQTNICLEPKNVNICYDLGICEENIDYINNKYTNVSHVRNVIVYARDFINWISYLHLSNIYQYICIYDDISDNIIDILLYIYILIICIFIYILYYIIDYYNTFNNKRSLLGCIISLCISIIIIYIKIYQKKNIYINILITPWNKIDNCKIAKSEVTIDTNFENIKNILLDYKNTKNWKIGTTVSNYIGKINENSDIIFELWNPIFGSSGSSLNQIDETSVRRFTYCNCPIRFIYWLLTYICQILLVIFGENDIILKFYKLLEPGNIKNRQLLSIRHWWKTNDNRFIICYKIIKGANNHFEEKLKKSIKEIENTHKGIWASGYEYYIIDSINSNQCKVSFISTLTPWGEFQYNSPLSTEAFVTRRVGCIVGLQNILTNNIHVTDVTDVINKDIFVESQDDASTVDVSLVVSKNTCIPNRIWIKKDDNILNQFKRHISGGLICIDNKILNKQKGVMLDLLTSAGKSLIEGSGISRISLPIRVFEAKSTLERLSESWSYSYIYLTKASLETGNDKCVERLKYIICFIISGLHRGIGQLKPFNPILGETFEGICKNGDDVYMEHTSHHPPISHYLLKSNNNHINYELYGYYEYAGRFTNGCAIGKQTGPSTIKFTDGTIIKYTLPSMKLCGLLWGERSIDWIDNIIFNDITNNMICNIKLYQKKSISIFNNIKYPLSDEFIGNICRINGQNDETVLSKITGSWLEGIYFDNEPYWLIDREIPNTPSPVAQALPSDCRYRVDLIWLSNGFEEKAQKWKIELEKMQRKDKELRKNNKNI